MTTTAAGSAGIPSSGAPSSGTTASGTSGPARQAIGAYGEERAARYLTARGLTVIDRNWRCDEGEIDIVLRDGATLVVCEVKTRTSLSAGTPHEAITDAKLARLKRLGERWAADHDIRPAGIRIDLVAVLCRRKGAPSIDHVQGLI